MKEILRNALDLIIIPDDLSEQVSEGIYRVERERNGIIMKRSVKKLTAVALAAVLIIAVGISVFAANTFSDLIGEKEAVKAAMAYVVGNAEESERYEILSSLLMKNSTDEYNVEQGDVKIGLSKLRAVYNIKFTANFSEYTVQVDGKTATVLSCVKADSKVKDDKIPISVSEEISKDEAIYTMMDHFGLCDFSCNSDIQDMAVVNEAENGGYAISVNHGGYKYSCSVDRKTGEVSDSKTEPLDYSDGEVHLHEPSDKYIGIREAYRISMNELSLADYQIGSNILIDIYCDPPLNSAQSETYNVFIQLVDMTSMVNLIIDAKDGEVLQNEFYSAEIGDPTKSPNQPVSTEAPDGIISEAMAKSIALDDANVMLIHIAGFEIELNENRYSLQFEGSNEDGLFGYYYTIDAVSGDILEKQVEDINEYYAKKKETYTATMDAEN